MISIHCKLVAATLIAQQSIQDRKDYNVRACTHLCSLEFKVSNYQETTGNMICHFLGSKAVE